MTHLRTRAVHAGQHLDAATGAIATPIIQTTAFGYGTLEHGAAIFSGDVPGYRYNRFANPIVGALEVKIADLEGGPAAVAFASGTAATSSVSQGLLNPGDEIAFLGPLFGGTEGVFRSLGSTLDPSGGRHAAGSGWLPDPGHAHDVSVDTDQPQPA